MECQRQYKPLNVCIALFVLSQPPTLVKTTVANPNCVVLSLHLENMRPTPKLVASGYVGAQDINFIVVKAICELDDNHRGMENIKGKGKK